MATDKELKYITKKVLEMLFPPSEIVKPKPKDSDGEIIKPTPKENDGDIINTNLEHSDGDIIPPDQKFKEIIRKMVRDELGKIKED